MRCNGPIRRGTTTCSLASRRRWLLASAVVAASVSALIVATSGQAVQRTDVITTIAGGGTATRTSQPSSIAPTARKLEFPTAVAVAQDGKTMLVGDDPRNAPSLVVVRGLSTGAASSTVIDYGYEIGGAVFDSDKAFAAYPCWVKGAIGSRLVAGDYWNGRCGFTGDGGPSYLARLGRHVRGIALDSDLGRMYIADWANHRVRWVDMNAPPDPNIGPKIVNGAILTLAGTGEAGESGDGGLAVLASLTNPVAVAVDSSHTVYIATRTRVRKVTPDGRISTVFDFKSLGNVCRNGSAPDIAGMAIDPAGTLYVSVWNWNQIYTVQRSGGRATRLLGPALCGAGFAGDGRQASTALLRSPWGLATDANGSLYIADAGNGRIRVVRNDPPRAALKASPQSGTAPLTVTFDARASSDPDGSIRSYLYQFQYPRRAPGTPRLRRSTPVSYTYRTPGRYLARVTVTDDSGATAVATVRIIVG